MTVATFRRFRSEAAWLAARRIGGTGASAVVGAALGFPTYNTPGDVLDGLRPPCGCGGRAGWGSLVCTSCRGAVAPLPPEPPSEAMARGQRVEPYLLQRYADEARTPIRRLGSRTLFEREEWATASLDAIGPARLVVEGKSSRRTEEWGESGTIERWERWGPNATARTVRLDYYFQVVHYMWVVDAPAADLAVLLPREDADPFDPPERRLELRRYRLQRDHELEAAVVGHLRDWWRLHVLGDEPLPSELATIRRRREGVRPATAEEARLAREYAEAAQVEKSAKDRKRAIGRELVAAAGGASRLDVPGGGRVTIVSSTSAARLDEQRLEVDHPGLLAAYREPGHPYVFPRVSGVGGSS